MSHCVGPKPPNLSRKWTRARRFRGNGLETAVRTRVFASAEENSVCYNGHLSGTVFGCAAHSGKENT